jgi:hypothetical protein
MVYHAPDDRRRPTEADRLRKYLLARRLASLRPRRVVPAGSWFSLMLFVLSCVSLACVLLGLSSGATDAPAGKRLRPAGAIPNLSTVHTDVVAPAESESVEPVATRPPEGPPAVALPRVVTMEPVPHELPAVAAETLEPALLQAEPALAPQVELTRLDTSPAEADSEPTILLPRASTFGESPMIRNWKVFALSAFLAAYPAAAGETSKAVQEKKEPTKTETADTVVAEIQRLEKTILSQLAKTKGDLKTEIDEVRNEQFKHKLQLQTIQALSKKVEDIDNEVLSLTSEVRKLRKMLASAEPAASPRAAAAPAADRTGLEEIRNRLAAIELALTRLQPAAVPSTSSRTSLSAPTSANHGRVNLVNLYNEDMLFVVNGRHYRVAPGASLPLDGLPSGSLTYEVMSPTWGLRAHQTTTLLPTETLTLTASR